MTSQQTKRRAAEARLAKNDDPKQRKLSFVPRVRKKRPAEFVDLGSDEVGTRGQVSLCIAVFLRRANPWGSRTDPFQNLDGTVLFELSDLAPLSFQKVLRQEPVSQFDGCHLYRLLMVECAIKIS